MKRFVSMDPLGYVDSMNMYESFGCDPVNNVDPMGLRTDVTLLRYSTYIPSNMSLTGETETKNWIPRINRA